MVSVIGKTGSSIWALLIAAVFFSGCVAEPQIQSSTLARPGESLAAIRVLYLTNRLVSQRGSDKLVADAVYKDIPMRLSERVPAVFALNGIRTDYAISQNADFRPDEATSSVKWGRHDELRSPLLVIQVTDGYSVVAHGNVSLVLNLHIALHDIDRHTKLWNCKYRMGIGTLREISHGHEVVDKMLKAVLDQMARDGLIQLLGDAAVLPA